MVAKEIRQFSFYTSTADIHRNKVNLLWVPEHKGILGNEKPNDCAEIRSSLDQIMASNHVQTTLDVVANKIQILREITTKW